MLLLADTVDSYDMLFHCFGLLHFFTGCAYNLRGCATDVHCALKTCKDFRSNLFGKAYAGKLEIFQDWLCQNVAILNLDVYSYYCTGHREGLPTLHS